MAIVPLAREIPNLTLNDQERLVPYAPTELRGIPGHLNVVSVDAFQMAGQAEGSHIGVFIAAARRTKLYMVGRNLARASHGAGEAVAIGRGEQGPVGD